MAIVRTIQAGSRDRSPAADSAGAARSSGRRRAEHALDRRAARWRTRRRRSTSLASPSNHEVFEADPQVNRVQVAERTWFERRPGALGAGHGGLETRPLAQGVPLRPGHRRARGRAFGAGARAGASAAAGRLVDGRRVVPAHRRGGLDTRPPRGPLAAGTPGQAGNHSRRASPSGGDRPRRGSDRDRPPARGSVAPPRHRGAARLSRGLRSCERSVRGASGASLAAALRPSRSPKRPTGCTRIVFRRCRRFWPCTWEPETPPSDGRPGRGSCWSNGFSATGWRVVVVGGVDDVPLSSVLEPHEWLRDWTGSMTVAQTTALLERADLFIGADSGPAHLAASAGTLSVILFSGTNQARQWRPWSRHSLVLRHRVTCHPCHQKVCPLAGHPCMAGLHPDRVYRGAMRWWKRIHRAESPHSPL